MAQPPLDLVVASDFGRPDVAAALAALRSRGAPRRVLLLDGAIVKAAQGALDIATFGPDARIAICTRDARRRGIALDDLPAYVAWSSVATWHVEAGDARVASLWP